MAQVLDYSAGFPGAANVRGAGFVGAVRYIGFPARTKCTTAGELADFSAHGIGMALVYQDGTGDWAGGFGTGQANARRGRDHANAIGFPGGRPIYLAIDRDIVSEAQFGTVMSYLDGAASVLGRDNTGVYGEYDVVRRALDGGRAKFGWQTAAWSGGRRFPGAQLYQRIGTVYVGGIACDANDVLAADWGQHNLEADMTPEEHYMLLELLQRTRSMHHNGYLALPETPQFAGDLNWFQRQLEISRLQATVDQLSDDEITIIAAIRAQANGQASEAELAVLAERLVSSLGTEQATELGRQLPGGAD